MKVFAVVTSSGETIYIDADYFKVKEDEVHFYIGAEKRADVYVSSHGTVVVPEELVRKEVKGFD